MKNKTLKKIDNSTIRRAFIFQLKNIIDFFNIFINMNEKEKEEFKKLINKLFDMGINKI